MQEIRLHGRGGQGLVKASHIVVRTAVETGHYGQFIPFFGVERKGSPVFGFLRLAEEPIRRKTQVYTPDVLIILDDTLIHLPATYAGLREGGTVIINSAHAPEELRHPRADGEGGGCRRYGHSARRDWQEHTEHGHARRLRARNGPGRRPEAL